MIKPRGYAEACDRNKGPIFEVLQPLLVDCDSVLEIGSGTGQHAIYFAEKMPHLIWHTSDRTSNHIDIQARLDEAALANTRPPLSLDVMDAGWPDISVDAIFSANTAHIMSWKAVAQLFSGVGRTLSINGLFLLYGPFNYHNQYSSDSNRHFDQSLKQRDPFSGIRDFEAVDQLAQQAGMVLQQDYSMPTNNRLLCWRKTPS